LGYQVKWGRQKKEEYGEQADECQPGLG